jgi:hypothetical protein
MRVMHEEGRKRKGRGGNGTFILRRDMVYMHVSSRIFNIQY